MSFYLSLATEMRLFRIAHSLSVTNFAKHIGVSQATVSSYESGVRPIPPQAIDKYADIININRAFLAKRILFEDNIYNIIGILYNTNFCDIVFKELKVLLPNIIKGLDYEEWVETKEVYKNYLNLSKQVKNAQVYTLDEYKSTFLVALHRPDAKWHYTMNLFSIELVTNYFMEYISSWPPDKILEAQEGLQYQIENKVQLLDIYFLLFKSMKISDENSNINDNYPFCVIIETLKGDNISLTSEKINRAQPPM